MTDTPPTDAELDEWETFVPKATGALMHIHLRLIAEVRRLRDPSFDELVDIAERILNEHYSAHIFTGVSGDQGPRFVVALREVIAEIRNDP